MINKKKLSEIIKSNKDSYLIWNSVLHQYENCLSKKLNHENKIKEESFWNTFYVFSNILDIFLEVGNYSDQWEDTYYQAQFTGINTNITSKKTENTYSFGYYEGNYFLSTFLYSSQNYNKISDNFWRNLLSISQFGEVNFTPNFRLPKQNDIEIEQKYSSNSIVFNIIKNYLFTDFLDVNTFGDLGLLEVTWPKEIYWDSLLEKGSHSFELLYKLNYELWRNSN